MSESLAYLSVPAVQAIHTEVLKAHGGSPGIRDRALLESAIAAPQATMMGQQLISDPIEIAAAYLFYICGNHPFVDGNIIQPPPARALDFEQERAQRLLRLGETTPPPAAARRVSPGSRPAPGR